jgi:hypothetical protein
MVMVMEKKKSQFHILSNKSTTHEAYYTGTLNLSNLSSVLIDEDHAKIDLGLIHAKSVVERGIQFTSNPEEVPQGKPYWIVWIAIDRAEYGPYYAGATACSMIVDKEKRKGWKNLAEHVNRMDDALKRRIQLTQLGDREKAALKKLLIEHNPEMWENSKAELKEQLS